MKKIKKGGMATLNDSLHVGQRQQSQLISSLLRSLSITVGFMFLFRTSYTANQTKYIEFTYLTHSPQLRGQ